MKLENVNWDEFYQKVQGRAPRLVLNATLERFESEPLQSARKAIDLGCGDGTESAILLERGWEVLAIDGEPAALSRLMAKIPVEYQARLQTQVAKFEEVILSPTDLILASFSIPFCEPEHFDALWDKIVNSIRTDGRFAGHFFGVRDSWAVNTNMTFHTEEQVYARFEDFEMESFLEEEEDGQATSGPKHWHIFTVIAKKR
jgi:trans-aconitate methyltransferase